MASILLVGAGRMGSALLSGWLDQGRAADEILVIEPDVTARERIANSLGLNPIANADSLDGDVRPAVIVLAVKPQAMGAVVPSYRAFSQAGSVVLSIAAGVTSATLSAMLFPTTPVVRAMPNTPAAVKKGITAAYANAHVAEQQRSACQDLLAAVGDVVWLDDESLMDAVTAVSGSGPAYVFLLAEALAAAGEDLGLSAQLAERLARATIIGASELLGASSASARSLRRDVTSPGGTTEAALKVLTAGEGLHPLMLKAVRAAHDRSCQLAG